MALQTEALSTRLGAPPAGPAPSFGFRFGGNGPFGGGAPGNHQAAGNSQDKKTSLAAAVPEPPTGPVTVSAAGQPMPQAAQAIARSDAEATQQAVQVFDLANADPRDVQQTLQDLFQRSGNIRANNSNNRSSMLGTGNPLMQREIQKPSNSASPSSGPGNDLAGSGLEKGGKLRLLLNVPPTGTNLAMGGGMMGGMGGGMMGGGMGGGGGMSLAWVPHVNIAPSGGGGIGGTGRRLGRGQRLRAGSPRRRSTSRAGTHSRGQADDRTGLPRRACQIGR